MASRVGINSIAEVAGDGVRVNAVCPGMIVGTPMRERLDAQAAAWGAIPLSEG